MEKEDQPMEIERVRLSKMEEQELVIVAIEKARKKILSQAKLIKGLNLRIEELEDRAEFVDDDLECIHRVLEVA